MNLAKALALQVVAGLLAYYIISKLQDATSGTGKAPCNCRRMPL